jgi:hypothetical protein
MVALSVFHFSVAALAGMGAHWLYSKPEWPRVGKVVRGVGWFGAAVFGLACLHGVTPAISLTADSRIQMVGFLAILLAGLYHAWSRGYLRREWALALVGLLLVVEQGNEVASALANKSDAKRAVLLRALVESQDVADFLYGRPSPKRVTVTDDAGWQFSFGDWYRIDSTKSTTASMLAQTAELGWWQDRMVRMYGINYMVSKTATRAGQQELFTGKSGVKVFLNPDALPRAWTVHEIIGAPDEPKGAEIVRDGDFDLGAAALMVGAKPGLDRCEAADRVTAIDEAPSSVRVDVAMACKGLLIVSDNWYPGWRAEVDGEPAPIWKVNTIIRGVVVDKGRHTMVMKYRPASVYFGFICTILGLAGAVLLQRRREEDDAEYAGGRSAEAEPPSA